MSWSHSHVWPLKIRQDCLAAVVSLGGARGHSFAPGSPCQGSSARKRSTNNIWLWKLEECIAEWDGGWLELLLKGLHRDLSLMDSLALNSSTGESAQKVPGTYKKELHSLASGIWLEGQLSPRQKCHRIHVPLLSPCSSHHTDAGCWLSINPVNTDCPALMIPWGSTPPCLWVHPSSFLEAFPYKQFVLAYAGDSLKISQRFTIPKQVVSDLSMPHTSPLA